MSGEPVKEYDPQEPVTITMTREQWDTVAGWLEYGTDYHHAKMTQWLACCKDKDMAGQKAAEHQREMEKAKNLHQIVETALEPPAPATE